MVEQAQAVETSNHSDSDREQIKQVIQFLDSKEVN